MPKKKYRCPAEMTLDLIGGKWKIIVLWLLRKGGQRSGRLKSQMPGISATAFSQAVRELEAVGLVQRRELAGANLAVSYALTVRGESLKPIVRSLVKWGLEHREHYALGEFLMVAGK